MVMFWCESVGMYETSQMYSNVKKACVQIKAFWRCLWEGSGRDGASASAGEMGACLNA